MTNKKISKEYKIEELNYEQVSGLMEELYSEEKYFRARSQRIYNPKTGRAVFLNKNSQNHEDVRLEIDGEDSEIVQIVKEIKSKGIKLKEI